MNLKQLGKDRVQLKRVLEQEKIRKATCEKERKVSTGLAWSLFLSLMGKKGKNVIVSAFRPTN